MKRLFTTVNSAQVNLARSVLEAAKIHCEMRHEMVSQAIPSAPFAAELWVREEDFEEASALLKGVEESEQSAIPEEMDYLLVLQFRGDAVSHLDSIIAIEEQLIEKLGESVEVDGHDVGSGEINLFIFTSDPRATFEGAKSILEGAGFIESVTAAYRRVDGEEFTVIWPDGSAKEFRIG